MRDFHFVCSEYPVRIDSLTDREMFVAAILCIGQEVMYLFASITLVWIVFLIASIDVPQVPQRAPRSQKWFFETVWHDFPLYSGLSLAPVCHLALGLSRR